jgi:hypothetical protein
MEVRMLVLKAVTVIAAGVLSVLAMRRLMENVEAAKARVRVKPSTTPRAVTRLRQDPRTGIYYPEG